MLTQARLKELLSYDPDTGIFRHSKNRGPARIGNVTGSLNSEGYLTSFIDGKHYKCHRLAWMYITGSWPSGEIDHIDGNRLNNSFSNLRDVSKNTNQQNLKRAKTLNKSTGLLGVTNKKGRFVAQIQANKKSINIGCFDTAEEAHEAYLKTKRELHQGCTI